MTQGRRGRWIRQLLRHRSGVIGLTILGLFLIGAVVGVFITDPNFDDYLMLSPPSPWFGAGSGPFHLFGTDNLGRDVFTRLVAGALVSFQAGVLAMGMAALIGIPLGLIAGVLGDRSIRIAGHPVLTIDSIVSRGVDLMMAFPSILLAIVIMATIDEPGLGNVIVAVGIVAIPSFIRQVRASALSVREHEYVHASRALGASNFRIMVQVVLPNCLAPIIVIATLGVGTAILSVAGLSFLGFGVEPGTPEWGAMLTDTRNIMYRAPWVVFAPGGAITLTVLGFNLLGDGLRDVLDPKMMTR